MKTCDEMVNSLFKRREQYLAEQKRKRRNAVISAALYCCAFAVIGGIALNVKTSIARKTEPVAPSSMPSAEPESNIMYELKEIWAVKPGNYGDLVDEMDSIIDWNGKRISGMLYDALNNDNENCLYAVEARYFPVDEQFVYNGKTLAQYEAEYSEKWEILESKFIVRDLLEAADSLKIENGDKLSKDTYDELVSYVGERFSKPDIEEKISEYIVDGVFLKDKASQDYSKPKEEWEAAMKAQNQAQKACRADYYKEVGKQLEAKGIKNELIYEDTDQGDFLDDGFVSDYLLLLISKEDFANLTLDNMSDWIFCHAYRNKRPIIWAEEIEGDAISTLDHYVVWNGKELFNTLYSALEENETDDNCLFAVSAFYGKIDGQFVYNGKTLAQYEEEAQGKRLEHLNQLLKIGEVLKYGEALYQSGTPDGEKWTKELYDATVAEYGEDMLSEYIVDGVFLRDKVLQDIPEAEKEFEIARQTFDRACAAYRVHVYEETLEQLEAQGIEYELSKDPDNLLLFISKEDFANLTLDNISDWFFFHASKSEKTGSDTVNE